MTLTREQIEELRLDYMLLTAEEVDALCDLALAALEQRTVADLERLVAKLQAQIAAQPGVPWIKWRDDSLAMAVRACEEEASKCLYSDISVLEVVRRCIAAIEALRSAGAAAP